ncbi:MAG: TlpA family protein disulfide reductase [Akkermansiaceae bacterium]|nr:TlpA family protein disulfide reductase [Akkermansiaceae bacterium]
MMMLITTSLKKQVSSHITLGLSSVLLLLAVAPAMAEMHWLESGMSVKTFGNRPHHLALSDTAPASIKRAPEGLRSPRYATLILGPKAAPARITIILDEVKGRPDRIHVDANANGDFTDDPALTLTTAETFDPDNAAATQYQARATVEIPFASGMKKGRIEFFQTRSDTKYDLTFRKSINYYADYGWFGEMEIGGKNIPTGLSDAGGCGDFREDENVMNTPILWFGVGSGPKAKYGTSAIATKPFELEGKWWRVKDLTPDGHFSIVATVKPADAKPVKAQAKQGGPDLTTGKPAPVFTGKLLGGKAVNFPADYKGKIVLLDFWATWCGPCIREIPHVLEAHKKFHSKGFEVLGVSLDRAADEAKLAKFTKAKGMAWPQVFDGRFWDAEVSKLYGIRAVPYMILIDGDTGLVIVNDIAGHELGGIVEKTLAKKKSTTP